MSKVTVHYFPRFSVRIEGLGERPVFRFAGSNWRTEELSRSAAAREIRAARRQIRSDCNSK